ncbi:MAG: hypothetical protein M3069_32555 [Chloroflexota bacterium]|nr:hypothetical protein [Chloroflexota bacterium]
MRTARFLGDAQVLGHYARGGGVLHDLLARAWPWAGVLVISMTLAGAMNVGVTAFQQAPDEAKARPLALSAQGFMLTIVFKDLDGAPSNVTCRTSRDLVSADVLYMPSAQDVYEHVTAVCREPPP